jgi:predicted nucleic acid-binding protein
MKNGVDILVDSNIFIYWLSGNAEAAEILSENNIYYSIISEIEVNGHTSLLDKDNKTKLNKLFTRFERVGLSNEIKDLAIQYKIAYNLKTPDGIICASSRHLKIPLITGDKKNLL